MPMSTVPVVGSFIPPALATGGVVSTTTVTVATALVAVMGAIVAITRYCVPLSAIPNAEVHKDAVVPPATLAQVVLPGGSTCH